MTREQEIEKALVELGIARDDFQFGAIMGPGNPKYVRYRYWKSLPLTAEQIADLGLQEDSDWDEDCGYRYSYIII